MGLGTFRPVHEDNILLHKMHSEFATISNDVADIINHAKDEQRRVIAVGQLPSGHLKALLKIKE